MPQIDRPGRLQRTSVAPIVAWLRDNQSIRFRRRAGRKERSSGRLGADLDRSRPVRARSVDPLQQADAAGWVTVVTANPCRVRVAVDDGGGNGAITADQSRGDRRRLRLDGRGVRADSPGAQRAISADGLSDRLAARRQRRVRPRPGGRIEEHGLHIWLGYYENAFRLLRECYAELGADRAAGP